jgi:hypothetical protein
MFPHARASEIWPNNYSSRKFITRKLASIDIFLSYCITEYFLASIILTQARISVARRAAYRKNKNISRFYDYLKQK